MTPAHKPLPQSLSLPFWLALGALLPACASLDAKDDPTVGAEPMDIEEWAAAADSGFPEPPAKPEAEPPAWKSLRYTLDLSQVPLASLARQLADDAQLRLFIGGRVSGSVSLLVREQALDKILAEIERRSRYYIDIENDTLMVLPNDHEMRSYGIGYPNLTRQTRSQIQTSLQLAVGANGADTLGQGNQSLTEVSNSSSNDFWASLVQTLEALIGSEGDAKGKVSSRIIAHPESGLIMAYASRRQHRLLAREIERLMKNMRRQALIEISVLEIELSNTQRNGLDWQAILGGSWRVWQRDTTNEFSPTFGVGYTDNTSKGITSAMIELLESFGNVRVVSQPKLMALNNQSAVLKVVNERVYFSTQVENILSEGTANVSYQTTIHSVPEGFTMTITPWINDKHDIILNLKPSLTRVVRMVNDPNPALANAKISSAVPELQIREMETVMRIRHGRIGVIGGLIQESSIHDRSGIPKAHTTPGVGWLFGSRRKELRRSELVILLRPLLDSG